MSCPDCFSGNVHAGSPRGEVIKLHGLDAYVTEPEGEAKGIIVIIPDAFGWEFVNNRILADHYAAKGGYRVYLPDFMKGNAAPVWSIATLGAVMKTGSLMDWVVKPYHVLRAVYAMVPFMYRNRPVKSWPIVKGFFAALRKNEGAALPVGAAGFCWGGKHTVFLAQGVEVDGKPLINAGFTGHPSMLEIPGDIEKITIPVSFAMGELDSAVKLPQIKQIESVLAQKEGAGEVKIYYGAGHGFCVRADVMVKDVERQALEAEDQAIEWFKRHFAEVSS
ncbi:dienelactone hydrolase family protein [Aspergillus heteromorphus CBS 117.55]|uniref:Dienelactone hydrolase family protein n=1 Tax=Aspergillus heteromorphus CBS 117.55 TaxID=1448321 RepID=A0A317WL61_9EURO|nr:dienelactone hydrolase family protein [Aspergillus heteromorphus CBS 117.55]PWY86052.1 dienelactone hydrolase family protein [Aspergillus heteromorphus CBS 117.55]